jgi:signal peptide peptidase SppA
MNVLEILNSPWAIRPETLTEMCAIYATHRNGESIDLKAIEAALGRPMNNEPKPYTVQDGVAVIPLEGVLSKRMSLFSSICGGQSYQSLQTDLAAALSDPDVTAIVLSIDSPGGSVDGVQGAADAVYAARQQKPIVAYVDGMMASAAYWVGSAASQIYIGSDTDVVGSIGVVTQHVDTSNAEHQRGIKVTDITAGKYKRIDSSHAPLTQEGRDSIQDQLDQVYGSFLGDVARNRGIDSDTVHSQMGDGRIFRGQKAIDAGLADGKTTLPQLIQKMKSQKGGAQSAVPQPKPRTGGKKIMAEVELTKVAYDAAIEDATQAGIQAGIAQGRTEGATAECARIQAVEKAALPGHEQLIASLKFDGKTTGAEAALQVVAAEKKALAADLKNMRDEAAKPVPESTGTQSADAAVAKPGAPGAKVQQIDAHATAEAARSLVADAKKEGRTLTYAAAVQQIIAAK